MSTQIPVGPKLVFRAGRNQPVVVTLKTSERGAFDLTDQTVLLRIGPLTATTATAEFSVSPISPATDGRGSVVVDGDGIAAGHYRYTLYWQDADRDLVEGPCEVELSLDSPA